MKPASTTEQITQWISRIEDIDIEFKEAKNTFNHDKDLFDYCAAIANGNGGKLILGVSDKKAIVGTQAFKGTHTKLPYNLWQRLKIHVDVEELFYSGKRLLIFHVPRHPPGTRVKSGGRYTYPIRRGESLGEMDDHKAREILNEGQPDFSAILVENFSVDDLDPEALQNLKTVWADKKQRPEILNWSDKKILDALNLIENDRFKGLSREQIKELILNHIRDGKPSTIDDLLSGFPEYKSKDLSNILQELKRAGRIWVYPAFPTTF